MSSWRLLVRKPVTPEEVLRKAALERTVGRMGVWAVVSLMVLSSALSYQASRTARGGVDLIKCQFAQHRLRNEEAHLALEETLIKIAQAAHVPLSAKDYASLLTLEEPTQAELTLPHCPGEHPIPVPTITVTRSVRAPPKS